MKSNLKQLRNRGLVNNADLLKYKTKTEDELIAFLTDPVPWKRTVGVRLLAATRDEKYLPHFIELLKKETKLYTKIAVSEVLVEYGQKSLCYLVPLLGRIGNNQLRVPQLVDINKKSYPLPRDIAARIIIRIGTAAIPELTELLESGTERQIPETIDAIGHISHTFNDSSSEQPLFDLLSKSGDNELIEWKIIRAFQAFTSDRVQRYLTGIISSHSNTVFIKEAQRSLRRINERDMS